MCDATGAATNKVRVAVKGEEGRAPCEAQDVEEGGAVGESFLESFLRNHEHHSLEISALGRVGAPGELARLALTTSSPYLISLPLTW